MHVILTLIRHLLGFMKVFSHDTQGGLFSSQDEAASKNADKPFTAQLFSTLDQLENFRDREGNFHFKLWPKTSTSNI